MAESRLGKIGEIEKSKVCHLCNNEGKPGGCPRCGLTPRSATSIKMLSLDVPTDIIPTPYQGVLWEKPNEPDKPLRFQQFDDSLEKVNNLFLSGKVPSFSMFIGAPPKSGKNNFAYSCMQTALAQKFSVAPLLSTADWRRLQKVSQMNPFYKLYGKYKWDDLISLDVVFMFVDHSDEKYDEIPLLKSVLDSRAAFCLPTFIISDYKLNDLVPAWNKESYSAIYNSADNRDYYRYPVVLHRFN